VSMACRKVDPLRQRLAVRPRPGPTGPDGGCRCGGSSSASSMNGSILAIRSRTADTSAFTSPLLEAMRPPPPTRAASGPPLCGICARLQPRIRTPHLSMLLKRKKLCWPLTGPAGCLTVLRARSTIDLAAYRTQARARAKNPNAVRQRMTSLDLTRLRPHAAVVLGRYVEGCARGVRKIEPRLNTPSTAGLEDRDTMVRTQRGDTFASPTIAVAGFEVRLRLRRASDQIVVRNQCQPRVRPR